MPQTLFNPVRNLTQSISNYENYCEGYNGVGNYLIGFILNIDQVKTQFNNTCSQLLDNINAFDKAEVSSTYIGQINMIQVSSFSGPQGLIWGYDLAQAKLGSPIFTINNTKVYDLSPLEDATYKLFGSLDQKNFPLLPGSHVPCAGKFNCFQGPSVLFSGLALGIPENRSQSAALIMEDVGELPCNPILTTKQYTTLLKNNLVKSIFQIGNNHAIKYQKIFVNTKIKEIKKGYTGCALVAAPYFKLAQKALPKNPSHIIDLDLKMWDSVIGK